MTQTGDHQRSKVDWQRRLCGESSVDSKRAYLIWGVAALYAVYQFSLQVSMAVFAPQLKADLQINEVQIGMLAALFAGAYGILQIPVGLLIDRLSVRWLMTGGLVICAIATFALSQAQDIFAAGLARAGMGLGASFGFVGAACLASRWFSPGRFAVMIGLTEMAGMLGAAATDSGAEWLQTHVPWREILKGAAAFGLLLAALHALVIRDFPASAPSSRHRGDLALNLGKLLTNSQLWITCAIYFISLGVLLGFAGLWNVPFQQSFSLSLKKIAGDTSLIFLGWGAGSLFAGWLAQRLGKRLPALKIGLLGHLAIMAVIIYTPLYPDPVIWVFRLTLGFFGGMNIITFAIAADFAPPALRGTAMGMLNTFGFLGVTCLQYIPGLLLAANAPHLTGDYIFALNIYLVALVVALILVTLLRERPVPDAEISR